MYKLDKPFTNIERADFICEHQGMNFAETAKSIYMLEDFEKIENGNVIDISQRAEYIAQRIEQEHEIQKVELQKQIDELDKKRIRAVCEPSMKTETQSWLEYYNEQIAQIRQVMATL